LRYHVSVVAKFLIQIGVALPLFLLWYAVLTLVVRAFGVRLAFPCLRRHIGNLQRLTFSQHIWLIGVLYWGCGMWIVTTFGHYIGWKYWSGSGHDLSAEELLFGAVLWPLCGALFGWMTWNTKKGNAES
jgi:hypothetical protein